MVLTHLGVSMARRPTANAGALKDVARPNDGEVVEGLICALCMKQARNLADLQAHFAAFHKDGGMGPTTDRFAAEDEDGDGGVTRAHWEPDSARSVCAEPGCGREFGLVARRTHCRKCGKIYCKDHCVITMRLNSNARPDANGIPCRVCQSCFASREGAQQEFGQSRNLMETFKRTREEKNGRDDIETNKLIIRLEKLLDVVVDGDDGQRPRAASVMGARGARREHEQAVVAWKDDASVRCCPECGTSFGLLTRRHHCRLCGGVMCGKPTCNTMLPIPVARQLLNGDRVSADATNGADGKAQKDAVRICETCRVRVFRHAKQIRRERQQPPAYLALYGRLSLARERIQALIPKYSELCERASNVRNAYAASDTREAMAVRQEIMQHFEVIDAASKRIAAIPAQEQARLQELLERSKQPRREKGDDVPDPRDVAKQLKRAAVDGRICAGIRLAATGYMQDVIPQLERMRPDRQHIEDADRMQKAEAQSKGKATNAQAQREKDAREKEMKEKEAREQREREQKEKEAREQREREEQQRRAAEEAERRRRLAEAEQARQREAERERQWSSQQRGGQQARAGGHMRNASSPAGMSPATTRAVQRGDTFDDDDVTPSASSSASTAQGPVYAKSIASDNLFDHIANSPPTRRVERAPPVRSATVSGRSVDMHAHREVLAEQRRNVVSMIAQARRDRRWEDADILSRSLADIDKELERL